MNALTSDAPFRRSENPASSVVETCSGSELKLETRTLKRTIRRWRVGDVGSIDCAVCRALRACKYFSAIKEGV